MKKIHTDYHENGKKSAEGYFSSKTDWEVGVHTFWDEDGNKEQVQTFKDDGSGDMHGMFTRFREYEIIDFQMLMKDNENFSGRWIWYDENGRRTKMEKWDNGKLISKNMEVEDGHIIYNDEKGNVRQEQNFNNGVLNGYSKSYLEDGKLLWSMEFKDGKCFEGEWARCDDNGKIEIKEIWKDGKLVKREFPKKFNILKSIKDLLIEKAVKMPASDIDAFLKHQDVDEIKELCEGMYHNGEISRTANYRYFILSEEKKSPKKASAPKSEAVDVEKELEKFKGMLDKGLINQEDYDAKKKELLGL